MNASPRGRQGRQGFSLVEMIVVVLLLALAMLGILAVFDASARINKSESEVADAQGNVRFSIYQMTRAIRVAGTGGLFVTQAVLNHADPNPNLGGISIVNSVDSNSYDNVEEGTSIAGLDGPHDVRPGTDIIEVRGVINSPLLGFDETKAKNGCDDGQCLTNTSVNALPLTGNPLIGTHVNDDPAQRPQFAAIDAFTAGASNSPMYVVVAQNEDIHNCFGGPLRSAQNPNPIAHYPQAHYNVGTILAPTRLVASQTFGTVNFADPAAIPFDGEFPGGAGAPTPMTDWLRHAGILEDLIFFIDNNTQVDPKHPFLAQGTRRGQSFDIVRLADDVEDMQIAYGVDTNGDNAVGRLTVASPDDPDTNVSHQPGSDEWVPNVPGSDNPLNGGSLPFQATDFVASSGSPDESTHCPLLHAVMISLLAKSKNPDPTYRAPISQGYKIMNTTATPLAGNFRRRLQTIKINLRNYSFD